MGKGSNQRPTDMEKYREGWDRIFASGSAPGFSEEDRCNYVSKGLVTLSQFRREQEIQRLKKLLYGDKND